jgi:hypothetical protein
MIVSNKISSPPLHRIISLSSTMPIIKQSRNVSYTVDSSSTMYSGISTILPQPSVVTTKEIHLNSLNMTITLPSTRTPSIPVLLSNKTVDTNSFRIEAVIGGIIGGLIFLITVEGLIIWVVKHYVGKFSMDTNEG